IFAYPQYTGAPELIQRLPTEHAAAILDAIPADRAAAILQKLGEPARSRLLSLLDSETRASLRQLLSYPRHTAGSLMTTEFLSVPATWTVEATLRHIREVERTRETVYAIYILDPASGRLVRTASLRRLISSAPEAS